MNLFEKINPERLINQKTILYGEINTGKTINTARFLNFLIDYKKINHRSITILDFAPPLEFHDELKIGGKIIDYNKKSKKCIYPQPEKEIIPTRLNAENRKELCHNSFHNFKITKKMLELYDKNPTKVLLINDMSIFLHLGKKKDLLKIMNKAETFLGNIYYGKSIGDKNQDFNLFNLKEKRLTEGLIKYVDYSFKLETN